MYWRVSFRVPDTFRRTSSNPSITAHLVFTQFSHEMKFLLKKYDTYIQTSIIQNNSMFWSNYMDRSPVSTLPQAMQYYQTASWDRGFENAGRYMFLLRVLKRYLNSNLNLNTSESDCKLYIHEADYKFMRPIRYYIVQIMIFTIIGWFDGLK